MMRAISAYREEHRNPQEDVTALVQSFIPIGDDAAHAVQDLEANGFKIRGESSKWYEAKRPLYPHHLSLAFDEVKIVITATDQRVSKLSATISRQSP